MRNEQIFNHQIFDKYLKYRLKETVTKRIEFSRNLFSDTVGVSDRQVMNSNTLNENRFIWDECNLIYVSSLIVVVSKWFQSKSAHDIKKRTRIVTYRSVCLQTKRNISVSFRNTVRRFELTICLVIVNEYDLKSYSCEQKIVTNVCGNKLTNESTKQEATKTLKNIYVNKAPVNRTNQVNWVQTECVEYDSIIQNWFTIP